MQLGTRSQVKEFIKKGLITVNGDIVTKADYKINELEDSITCKGV